MILHEILNGISNGISNEDSSCAPTGYKTDDPTFESWKTFFSSIYKSKISSTHDLQQAGHWIPQVSSSCFCSFRAFLLLLLCRPCANSSDHSISSWGGSLATGRAGHCLLRFQLVGLIRISWDRFKESTGNPYH